MPFFVLHNSRLMVYGGGIMTNIIKFGPVVALLYFSWSIPLRLVFFFNEEGNCLQYPVFFIFDCFSDVLLVCEITMCYKEWIKKKSKVLPLGKELLSVINSCGDEKLHSFRETFLALELRNSNKIPTTRKYSSCFGNALQMLTFLAIIIGITPLNYFWRMPMGNVLQSNRLLFLLLFSKKFYHRLKLLVEETKTVTNSGIQRAIVLFMITGLAGHLASCAWFYVSVKSIQLGMSQNWAEMDDPPLLATNDDNDIVTLFSWKRCYLRSLYWAMITMITTGYGDIVPTNRIESITCVIIMYFGFLLCTFSIGNLTSLFVSLDESFTKYETKIDSLCKYMEYRNLPNEISDRVTSFYEYQWTNFKGVDEQQILNELPNTLRQSVSNQISRKLLKGLPVFKGVNNSFLNNLVLNIESNVLSPNDEILALNQELHEFHVISRGVAQVLEENVDQFKVVYLLKRGESIGLVSLFDVEIMKNGRPKAQPKSDYLIKAKHYMELFTLQKHDFQKVCEMHNLSKGQMASMRNLSYQASNSLRKQIAITGTIDDLVDKVKGFRKLFLPNSKFRKRWRCLLALGSVYYCFSTPLWAATAFPLIQSGGFYGNMGALSCSYSLDFIFALDLFFRYFCFYFEEEGMLVVDPERIKTEFLKQSSIQFEILICAPWDVVALLFGEKLCPLLRCFKVLRILNIRLVLETVVGQINKSSMHTSAPLRRLVVLNVAMFLICHWVGCLFIMVGRISQQYGLENWIEEDQRDSRFYISNYGNKITPTLYLRSVYWALVGMSTVGYGDIVPKSTLEMAFATLVVLIGGMMVPAMVGGLAACILSLNQSKIQYRLKITQIREFLHRKKYSLDQIDKVQQFYDYLWCRQGGIDEVSILAELPASLREQVAIFITGDTISNVPLFYNLPKPLRNNILSVLIPRVFSPDDIIVYADEVGKEFYIIESGIAEVSVQNRSERISVALLGPGDYFGECCFIAQENLRSNDVKSVTFCDCFELSNEDFIESSKMFPDNQKTITASVREIIQTKKNFNQLIKDNIIRHKKILARRCGSSIVNISSTRSSIQEIEHGKEVIEERYSWWNNVTDYFYHSPEIRTWVLSFFLLHTISVVPVRLAFQTTPISFLLDYLIDFIFLVDFLMNINSVEVTSRQNVPNYSLDIIQIWNWIPLIPFECFLLIFLLPQTTIIDHSHLLSVVMGVARLPKAARAVNLDYCTQAIIKSLNNKFHLSAVTLQVIQLSIGVVLVSHWAACGYFGLARFNNFNQHKQCSNANSCLWEETWVYLQLEEGKLVSSSASSSGWINYYIRSINWALPTLVVVAIGDVIPVTSHETLFVLICILVGMTVNAAIIGTIAGIVANLETDSAFHAAKLDAINGYMENKRLSSQLQQKVLQYMRVIWNKHNGRTIQEETELISKLPKPLQISLASKSKLPYIKLCPFLDFCSDDIHRTLATCMQVQRYNTGDIIVQHGNMGTEMFFLINGNVEVISSDSATTYAKLHKGAFFGEQALFFKEKRTATVRAVEYCEVLVLKKKDLDSELLSREFDLSRMKAIFDSLKERNITRNSSLTNNLMKSEHVGSKLHRMIYPVLNEISNHHVRTFSLSRAGTPFRFVWDSVSVILLVYYMCSIPYRASFLTEQSVLKILRLLRLDMAIDLFFLVDIFLRYHWFSYSIKGEMVNDGYTCKMHYLETFLVTDLVASTPIELFACIPSLGPQSIFSLRIIHLLRCLRLSDYFTNIHSFINFKGLYISSSFTILLRMIFVFLLINHWCCCVWFGLHRIQAPFQKETWASTSMFPISYFNETSGSMSVCGATQTTDVAIMGVTRSDCYLRSFYMVTTTLTSVGFGDIYPTNNLETIWEIMVIFLACLLSACIIGAWQTLLKKIDETGDNAFRAKLIGIQNYMAYRQLTSSLQNQIILHYANVWHKTMCMDEKKILNDLPLPIRTEIAFEVFQESINKVFVLRSCSMTVKTRLADALMLQLTPPKSTIFEVDDLGNEIFFILRGSVLITPKKSSEQNPKLFSPLDIAIRRSSANKSQSIYSNGNNFGEACIFYPNSPRVEKAETLSSSVDMMTLSQENFSFILSFLDENQRHYFVKQFLIMNGSDGIETEYRDHEIEKLKDYVRRIPENLELSNRNWRKGLRRSSVIQNLMNTDKCRNHINFEAQRTGFGTIGNVVSLQAAMRSKLLLAQRALPKRMKSSVYHGESFCETEDENESTKHGAWRQMSFSADSASRIASIIEEMRKRSKVSFFHEPNELSTSNGEVVQ